MSSDESVQEDSDDNGSSSSDREEVPRHPPEKKKKLIKHAVPYCGREIQALMESLDWKIDRRWSARSRAMCLEVDVSGARESTRPKPYGVPEWACELFS